VRRIFVEAGPEYPVELFVGDTALSFSQFDYLAEWFGAPEELSLDPKWATAETDKLFLAAPAGQYDIQSITLEPLKP